MYEEHVNFVLDLVTPQISKMLPCEEVTGDELFDPGLFHSVPPSAQQYVFFLPLAILIAHGKVPLEYAGHNSEHRTLYRKTYRIAE